MPDTSKRFFHFRSFSCLKTALLILDFGLLGFEADAKLNESNEAKKQCEAYLDEKLKWCYLASESNNISEGECKNICRGVVSGKGLSCIEEGLTSFLQEVQVEALTYNPEAMGAGRRGRLNEVCKRGRRGDVPVRFQKRKM